MKSDLLYALIFTSCLINASNQVTAATSIQVSSIGKTELIGTTAVVSGSGGASNFSTIPVVLGTSFAKFQMVLADGSGTRLADLKITPIALEGVLDTGGGQSGLMIAQTVNSQGLVDGGTFSILTDFASPGVSGRSSITLRLDWLIPDTNTPFFISAEVTSFDYDFNQFLKISQSEYVSEQYGSALTRSSADGFTTWQAGNSDSSFTNPNHAVVFNTLLDNSMEIQVGKTGRDNSLFMFEFRDPSINLVPEPSLSLLTLLGLVGFCIRRRNH